MMREDIEPLWESEDNKDGGCFSFKIYKQDLQKLGEYLPLN